MLPGYFDFLRLAAFFLAALHLGFLLRRSSGDSLGLAFFGGLELFSSELLEDGLRGLGDSSSRLVDCFLGL